MKYANRKRRLTSGLGVGVGLGIGLLFLAAACGDSVTDAGQGPDGTDGTTGAGVTAEQLDGHEFWSTEVTEDGAERVLAEGSTIRLRFDGENLGASAGCNSLGGTYNLEDSSLILGDMSMTEMGCEAELHAQDEFLIAFLSAAPTATYDGQELRLTTADDEIVLVDASVANPDQAIIGTLWEVSGFVQTEVATSFATDSRGTIVFEDESTMKAFDGCAEHVLSVEVSDGSTGGPVEGDGEVQFGEAPEPNAEACPEPEYVAAFHAVFATGEATLQIDGDQLIMRNRDGNGVTFVAKG